MVVSRVVDASLIVAGGGAVEMELSKLVRRYSRQIDNKSQLIVNGYAKALEIIPRTLCNNAGLDQNEIMNQLRF